LINRLKLSADARSWKDSKEETGFRTYLIKHGLNPFEKEFKDNGIESANGLMLLTKDDLEVLQLSTEAKKEVERVIFGGLILFYR